jgi:hypothetical protein
MLQFFRSVGYNSGGFRERTRITLFKTFLRPLWEYCLCIMPNVKKYMNRLTKLQHKCLTAMFSVGINTSKSALQLLCGVPDVQFRWKELTARWHVRIRDRSEDHMVTIAKNGSNNFLKTRSSFASIGKNEIVQHFDESKDPKKKVTDSILIMRAGRLSGLRRDTPLMQEFRVDWDCKPRGLYSLSRISRKSARMCTLWMLGKLPGKPRQCQKCEDEEFHSYNHFMTCCNTRQVIDWTGEWKWFNALPMIRKMVRRMIGLERLLEPG